jgi:hypothetical protein
MVSALLLLSTILVAQAAVFKYEPSYVSQGDGFIVRYCTRKPEIQRPQVVDFSYRRLHLGGMVNEGPTPTQATDMIQVVGKTWTGRQCWNLRFAAPQFPGKYKLVARAKTGVENKSGRRFATSDSLEVIDMQTKVPVAKFVTSSDQEQSTETQAKTSKL